jgi:pyridoxamine 5'-phosphate oxidase
MPEAMTLATAGATGQPSARMVLLKSADDRGFVFFTSYESRKAAEVAENPRAALVFHWLFPDAPNRQVRVEGTVSAVSAQESDEYFRTRPPASQVAAWASHQSQVWRRKRALAFA